MTSKLLDEYPLLILPSLAVKVGLNESIVLQQVNYWLNTGGEIRDGVIWVYRTYDGWQQEFPFWSVETIRRIIRGLEEAGLLLSTMEYNRMKADRTKWYRIDRERLDALFIPPSKSPDHVVKLTSPSGQNDLLSSGQVDLSNNKRLRLEERESKSALRENHPTEIYTFTDFYSDYPNKKSPAAAERAWQKLKPDTELQAAIRDGLVSAKASAEWTRNDGRYIPYPASWLNAHGWKSEYTPRGNNDEENQRSRSAVDRVDAATAADLDDPGTGGPDGSPPGDGMVLAGDDADVRGSLDT